MKHFHCPVNGWDCPYYVDRQNLGGDEDEYYLCGMGFDGFNPYEECSDFFEMYGEDYSPEEYTDDTED